MHEIGHNLGMSHDFIDSDYKHCRKASDGETIPCSSCANYQAGNDAQHKIHVFNNGNGYKEEPKK